MKKIDIPLNDVGVKAIYETCINTYSSRKKQDKLLLYLEQIEVASEDYEKHMPEEFEEINCPCLKQEQSKEIIGIYEYMIVKKRVGGYYDSIISNVNHICPFCGEGVPRNIDHFLPKSVYPLLAVTPANLVPSCRDCNMEKNNDIPQENEDVPLHPYFDDIKEVWLNVELDFSHKDFLGFIFFNGLDGDKYPKLAKRIDAHIKVHGLQANYESHANSMINSKKRIHLKAANQSKDILLSDLKEELESYEIEDINSWRAALYRALIINIGEYVEWLIHIL